MSGVDSLLQVEEIRAQFHTHSQAKPSFLIRWVCKAAAYTTTSSIPARRAAAKRQTSERRKEAMRRKPYAFNLTNEQACWV
ncbi:hypothetical protein Baya_10701 [Bagarius yarrelli]|uniref:Uncharacterized protein n=1 Tax=Bagarius yarrelli TaxID=175774 RepID=A0A556UH53_BAGYA|nr:hypothetical protein Baya_10701 [Bagarius yarrelli]